MTGALYDMNRGFTDRAALDAVKLDKLQRQLARVYDLSPWHKIRFDAAGFRPEMLKTLDDLRHVPLMDKNDERASQAESQEKGLTGLEHHFRYMGSSVFRTRLLWQFAEYALLVLHPNPFRCWN